MNHSSKLPQLSQSGGSPAVPPPNVGSEQGGQTFQVKDSDYSVSAPVSPLPSPRFGEKGVEAKHESSAQLSEVSLLKSEARAFVKAHFPLKEFYQYKIEQLETYKKNAQNASLTLGDVKFDGPVNLDEQVIRVSDIRSNTPVNIDRQMLREHDPESIGKLEEKVQAFRAKLELLDSPTAEVREQDELGEKNRLEIRENCRQLLTKVRENLASLNEEFDKGLKSLHSEIAGPRARSDNSDGSTGVKKQNIADIESMKALALAVTRLGKQYGEEIRPLKKLEKDLEQLGRVIDSKVEDRNI